VRKDDIPSFASSLEVKNALWVRRISFISLSRYAIYRSSIEYALYPIYDTAAVMAVMIPAIRITDLKFIDAPMFRGSVNYPEPD
jgi:hypothetical protein